MAVLEHSTIAGAETALPVRLARAADRLLQFWRNRIAFRRLRAMSDWELADIGLDRDDLHNAWRRRVEVDPTLYLGMTVRARDALAGAVRID